LRFLAGALELEIEDHGSGFTEKPNRRGIGLVAMRERAELMGGQIRFSNPPQGGTLVQLSIPREKVESLGKENGKEDHSLAGR
jgi:signal transduction histidine kinase